MKKTFSFSLPLFLILACGVFGPAVHAWAAPEYTLTLNLPIPPIHTRWTNALKPWADEIEKRSAGRMVVEPYFAEALSPRSEAYESVRSGIADLTESGFEANAGQFPYHEGIMSIPSPDRETLEPSPILQGMYAQYPAVFDEISGVKLLFCHASPDLIIGTKSQPVRSLSDLKGLKINANSAMIAERLKLLGVSVVSMPISDVYTALESGVIDGTTLAFELLVARRFGDQIKYMTGLSLQNTLFYMVMNEDVYRSLPDDLRKIIDDVSGEFARNLFADYWQAAEFSALETWLTAMGGREMCILSADDYAKAVELMQPPVDAWFEMLKKRGLPGDAMKTAYYALESANSRHWGESSLYSRYLSLKQ